MEQGAKPKSTIRAAFAKVAFHAAVIGVLGVTALYTGFDITGAVTEASQNVWTGAFGTPAAAPA